MAIETQTAAKIYATQTASVPTLTATLVAPATPRATGTPRPTGTRRSTATPDIDTELDSLVRGIFGSRWTYEQSYSVGTAEGPGVVIEMRMSTYDPPALGKTQDFMIAASHLVSGAAVIYVVYRYLGVVVEDHSIRVSDIRLYERGKISDVDLFMRWIDR